MSCTNGLLTTTSGSAAGRVPAELRLAPREYLLHPPKSAINAKPAAIHSLAEARPLVFRPMRSSWSDRSFVSVAISLVFPIYCSGYLRDLNQKKTKCALYRIKRDLSATPFQYLFPQFRVFPFHI